MNISCTMEHCDFVRHFEIFSTLDHHQCFGTSLQVLTIFPKASSSAKYGSTFTRTSDNHLGILDNDLHVLRNDSDRQ